MTEMVLVSCSKSKLDGTHRAEDLYEPSDIFRKRRRFRNDERVHWGVLSAKHGYLRPWEVVADYDTHISERTSVWGAFALDDLVADLEHFDVDQVTVLAGKRYVDPLTAELEARGYDVVDYNRGLRPGERKRELKKANAPGEQSTLVTDGGVDESTEGVEQRFEYSYEEIGSQQHRAPSVIDRKAENGWRLAETLGIKGTSAYLVFERPVTHNE